MNFYPGHLFLPFINYAFLITHEYLISVVCIYIPSLNFSLLYIVSFYILMSFLTLLLSLFLLESETSLFFRFSQDLPSPSLVCFLPNLLVEPVIMPLCSVWFPPSFPFWIVCLCLWSFEWNCVYKNIILVCCFKSNYTRWQTVQTCHFVLCYKIILLQCKSKFLSVPNMKMCLYFFTQV